MANQFRNFILTINNPFTNNEKTKDFYTDENSLFEYCKSLRDIKYFIFQLERGEETETDHIQMYLEFSFGKLFSTIKNYFPTAHIESRKGTKKQAREYCSKEETRVGDKVYEFGNFAEERERSDISDIIHMIESGATDYEIMELYPNQFMRYSNMIARVRDTCLKNKYKNKYRDIDFLYIYNGKPNDITKYVMTKFDDIYRVPNYQFPFDDYSGEKILFFDDFYSSIDLDLMLKVLDGYTYTLPARWSNKVATYTKVIIASSLSLVEQYKGLEDLKIGSVLRFRNSFNIMDFKNRNKQISLEELEQEQLENIF